MSLILIPLVAGLVSALLIVILLPRVGAARILIDEPNHRSLHNVPTPRIGGAAIWLGAGVSLAVTSQAIPLAPLSALAIAVAVSLFDDWRAQPIALRLPLHFLAASIVAMWLFPGAWVTAFLVVLVIAGFANLFNFMDGADGLAGGMAVIGFATLGWVAWKAGHPAAAITLAVSGAAGGFLCFNLPPARVFMGDGGSVPLGMLAASVASWGIRDGIWPWWFPVLSFAPFILDASWTLLSRMLRQERFWTAHREHLYQRTILAGWSHWKLLCVAYPLMLLCGGLGLELLGWSSESQLMGLTLFCLCLTTVYAWLRMRVAAEVK